MTAAAKRAPRVYPSRWHWTRGLFTGNYGVIRWVADGQVETLNDRRGRERRFPTQAAAEAAIAKLEEVKA